MAKLGLGHLTSYRYLAYPFDDKTTAVTYNAATVSTGANAKIPADFMLDAVAIVPDRITELYVRRINWAGAGFQFQFSDSASGAGVFACVAPTLEVISANLVAGGYYILTLCAPSEGFTFRGTCDVGFINYLTRLTTPGSDNFAEFAGDNVLKLSDSVVERTPPKVLTFGLFNGLLQPKRIGINDHVRFIPGYNINIDLSPPANDTTELLITALPGGGDGTVPCIDLEQPPVSTLPMGLTPDSTGAVRIDGDECYAVTANRALNMLTIHGACYACCSCDNYVAVAKAVGNLMERTHDLRQKLDALLEAYTAAVHDYETRHFPALRKGYVTITGFRGISLDNKNGALNHAYVGVMLANKGEGPLHIDVLRVSVTPNGQILHSATKVTGTTQQLQGDPGGRTIPVGGSLIMLGRYFNVRGETLEGASVYVAYTINGRQYSASAGVTFT